jgi:hypothetical protein
VSDLGDLGDILGNLGSEGAESYSRGAIIGYAVRNGISANATMGMLRQAGVGFRESQVSEIYGAYKDQIAASSGANALDFDSNTGELLPGTPPANWTGQYVHQVTANFRTRDDEGNYQINYRTFGIKASETLSPFDAMNAAMQIVDMPIGADDENSYGSAGDLISMGLTGAYYDTNPGALSSTLR